MDRPEPLEFMFLARCTAGGKHEGWPVQLVLQAGGHDAHHAFVKRRVKHAHGRWRRSAFVKQRFGDDHGLLAHVALDLAALAVDAIKRFRQFIGAGGIVGQQAFNAQRHVRPDGRGVDARAQSESEIKGGRHPGIASGCYKKTS